MEWTKREKFFQNAAMILVLLFLVLLPTTWFLKSKNLNRELKIQSAAQKTLESQRAVLEETKKLLEEFNNAVESASQKNAPEQP